MPLLFLFGIALLYVLRVLSSTHESFTKAQIGTFFPETQFGKHLIFCYKRARMQYREQVLILVNFFLG